MPEQYDFATLPDYLRPGLDLIFIGINPGLYSVRRGHYFARSTSRFWPAFSRSKLSERIRRELRVDTLLPEHDSELPRFGIGLTDVVKRPSGNAAELTGNDFAKWLPVLLEKLHRLCAACGLLSWPHSLSAVLSGRVQIFGHSRYFGSTAGVHWRHQALRSPEPESR